MINNDQKVCLYGNFDILETAFKKLTIVIIMEELQSDIGFANKSIHKLFIIKNMKFDSEKQTIQKQPITKRNSTKQDFRLESQIGKGTFGKVYLAYWKQREIPVALKSVIQNKRYKNRELEILREINHPAIVQLYDFFHEETRDGRYLNLAMEYLPETLSRLLKNNLIGKQFMTNQAVKKCAFWNLSALAYLSDQKIGHRDIKPSNIVLSQTGEAKLCDFGSAKVLVPGQKSLAYICSRFYRAPELIFGAVDYGTSIDIWSLGCVISEMLTNIPIFEGCSNMNQLIKIVKVIGSPTEDDLRGMKVDKADVDLVEVQASGLQNKIRKANFNADKQLIELIKKMLVYDPEKRIKPKDAIALEMFSQYKPLVSNKLSAEKEII